MEQFPHKRAKSAMEKLKRSASQFPQQEEPRAASGSPLRVAASAAPSHSGCGNQTEHGNTRRAPGARGTSASPHAGGRRRNDASKSDHHSPVPRAVPRLHQHHHHCEHSALPIAAMGRLHHTKENSATDCSSTRNSSRSSASRTSAALSTASSSTAVTGKSRRMLPSMRNVILVMHHSATSIPVRGTWECVDVLWTAILFTSHSAPRRHQ